MESQTIGLTAHLNFRGRPITYVCDGVEIAIAKAIPGKHIFKFEDDYKHTVRVITHDWIFETTHLLDDDNVLRTPKSGHLIKRALSRNRVAIYRVEAPNNEPFWGYTDEDEFCVRIHTTFQREEEAES